MSAAGAAVGLFMEARLGRNALAADLQAVRQQLAAFATQLQATPLRVPVVIAGNLQQQVAALVQQAQAQAAAAPIVVPVVAGGAAGTGGGGGGAGGRAGGGSGLRGIRGKLFPYLLALRAGGDVAEAGGDLAGAASTFFGGESEFGLTDAAAARSRRERVTGSGRLQRDDDLSERFNTANADFIASGQKAIGRLPLVGGIVEGFGDAANRFGSAATNWATGKGFESDRGYAERVEKEVAAEERHNEALHRQAEIRGQITKEVQKEAEAADRRAAREARSGDSAFERRQGDVEDRRRALAEEVAEINKGEKYHEKGDVNLPLTEAARHLIGAKSREFGAYESSESASIARDRDSLRGRLGSELDVAAAVDRGDADAVALEKFRQGQRERAEGLRKTDAGQASRYETVVAPREEQNFLADRNRKREAAEAESDRRIADARAEAEEQMMRVGGRAYEADRAAHERAIDGKIAALQREVDAAADARQKALRQRELDAAMEAAPGEGRAFDLRQAKESNARVQDIGARTDASEARARRRDTEAGDVEFSRDWDRRVKAAEEGGDAGEIAMTRSERAAAERERARQKKDQSRRIDLETADANAQAGGQQGVGTVLGLREDIRRMQEDAGDDPKRKEQARQYGLAKVRAYLKGAEPQAFMGDAGAYANQLQMSILNGTTNEEARKLAEQTAAELDGKGQRGVLDRDRTLTDNLGVVGGDMKSAAQSLDKAAGKLAGVGLLNDL